ncbi:ATV_HP_G0014990.mRNA.1.CDS.1 [Saccharomyces cerevisiae]|nr:ATV_HP_G0014990.mRNA.1.CDS.1 [Saccharomyces cerevisiae]CAI6949955.1 ATV_HP_G0014990.mRNA.1.CDS.1 [Saccharomyces cerevisiae]
MVHKHHGGTDDKRKHEGDFFTYIGRYISSVGVRSASAKFHFRANILLRLDDKKHNLVKSALNQIFNDARNHRLYTSRFWPIEPGSSGHSHAYTHSGAEDHSQEHHRDQKTVHKNT